MRHLKQETGFSPDRSEKQHHREGTHLHVVPVTEDLSGSPLGVAARLGHVVSNNVWQTGAGHFEFQADVKYLVILRIDGVELVNWHSIKTTSAQ